jgi:hypothetical protein
VAKHDFSIHIIEFLIREPGELLVLKVIARSRLQVRANIGKHRVDMSGLARFRSADGAFRQMIVSAQQLGRRHQTFVITLDFR